MADNTAKFLVDVFKTRRMFRWRTDHPEQWQQFCDWAGTGADDGSCKLNEGQRKWLKYIQRTGPGANDPFVREHGHPKGFLVVKDAPDVTKLTETEWRELYLACQSTFTRLKANKASYDGVVQDFIANYAHLFDNVTDETLTANLRTEAAILELLKKMDDLSPADLSTLFGITKNEINSLVEKRDPGTNKITELKKDYNKKKDVRDKIQGWANKVLYPENSINKKKLEDAGFNEAFIQANRINLISDPYYGWSVPEVTSAKLNDFKANYTDFFHEMYGDEKDKDAAKILEAYKSCEPANNKVVSESVEKAKKDIDYNDSNSKNYVPPKMDSEMNMFEKIQKWAGDTYSDYFKKYEELRGARIYQHASEVKDILKQIDKAKIKTTDPLSKLVENAGTITKKLQGSNPDAAEAFEWMAKVLGDINNDLSMSSVMEKALKSGRKMNDLIGELIMRAAEDGKPETVKKAEIAMEVLATIKYGNTTSKVMDAIKEDKELFSILSNKDLSWNKYEGVKFVTAAIDKSVRAACLGIGRGGAFLVNRFRRHGIRFNGRLKNQKMRQAHEDYLAKTGAERLAARGAHGADTASAPVPGAMDLRSEYKIALDDNTDKRTNALNALVGGGPAPADADKFVEDQQRDLNTVGRSDEDDARARLRPFEYIIEQLTRALDLRREIHRINAAMGGAMTDDQIKLQKELEDLGTIDLTIVGGGPAFDPKTASEAVIEAALHGAEANPTYQGYQDDYNDIVNANSARQQHIDDYRKATKEIEIAQERIEERRKRAEKLSKKDVDGQNFDIYKHLMAYWDTLQNPSLTRFGPRRASKIQSQNSHLVENLFANNLAGYNVH